MTSGVMPRHWPGSPRSWLGSARPERGEIAPFVKGCKYPGHGIGSAPHRRRGHHRARHGRLSTRTPDYLVLEADREIGGYCKTVKKDGFVWDYSGHFFHFKHPEIEAWLRARMPGQDIRDVEKKSFIALQAASSIDFPFQKNIHQLPQDEFIDCLYDLYFARAPRASRTTARPETQLQGDALRALRPHASPRSSSSRTTRSSTRATSARSTRTRWAASSRTPT